MNNRIVKLYINVNTDEEYYHPIARSTQPFGISQD